MTTIGNIIKNKDYDYISIRKKVSKDIADAIGERDIFVGVAKSKDGEIIALDGDSYSKDMELVSYKEWNSPEEGVNAGLTIVIK